MLKKIFGKDSVQENQTTEAVTDKREQRLKKDLDKRLKILQMELDVIRRETIGS